MTNNEKWKPVWNWNYLIPIKALLKFEPRDLWIGVYWDTVKLPKEPYTILNIYICLIPTLPLHLQFELGWYLRKVK